jgi:hypothetical protein
MFDVVLFSLLLLQVIREKKVELPQKKGKTSLVTPDDVYTKGTKE